MSGAALSSRPDAAKPAKPGPASFLATRTAKLTVFYLLLTAMAFVFLGPYILTLFAAFKPIGKIFSEPAWTPPSSLYLNNFTYDFESAGFYRYLANTALVTGVLTLGQVVFSTLGAYAFARMNFPGRDTIFWIYLLTLMVPNAVTISGQRKMFQPKTNAMRVAVIRTGFESGTTMRARIRHSEQPSTRAASINSCGILRKNCRMRKIV